MPPTRFTKQEAISALNKALPPSSTSIHNPGLLSDGVQLVHELMGSGWGVDQLRFESVTAAAAATTVQTSAVAAGKYRYVLAAHGVQIGAPGVAKSFTLAIGDSVLALDAVLSGSMLSTLTLTGIAAYVGVTCFLLRPTVIPPGCHLSHNASAADAGMQLMIRQCFVDLDIGETPPIRF